jgi:hypothetical protein
MRPVGVTNQLQSRVSGAGATASAAAPQAIQFEAAKSAAAQRSATNIAVADSMAVSESRADVRRAGNLTFALRDGVWTDVRYKQSTTVVRVKAYSDAYFKLIEAIPDLKEPFSIGDRVMVTGKDVAIELGPTGKEQLSDRELSSIKDRW